MDCPRCNGIGYTSIMHDDDQPCPECHGTGDMVAAQYYLVGKPFKQFPSYRLPFPFDSQADAEAHNVCLGGGYVVVEVAEKLMSEDEVENAELDAVVEKQLETDDNKYGVSDDEQR